MRTLLVTHYFPPEVGAPQSRLSELARYWAEAGNQVTVLTGMPNHPTGQKPREYRRAIRRVENSDGYRVVRTWLYATPNEGFVRKTLGHLSFMASSVLLGPWKTGPADVVIASSPTFFSLISGWFISRLKRAKFIVEVRDLWPAIFVELGVLRNRRIISILEKLEMLLYSASAHVVVVSEGFRESLVSRGVPASKVTVIRNGVDIDRFKSSTARDEAIRSKLGANRETDVLVVYTGAHGISQSLTTIAVAADKLRDRTDIRFAFVGDGAAKAELEQEVSRRKLDNVVMLPAVSREEVPPIVTASDICLVPLRDVPLFSTFIPSKMFEYLAAARAVIGSVRGEAADILRAAGATVTPPGDATSIAAAISALADDPGLRSKMGTAGMGYVETHFDRRVLAENYRQLLNDVVRGRE